MEKLRKKLRARQIKKNFLKYGKDFLKRKSKRLKEGRRNIFR